MVDINIFQNPFFIQAASAGVIVISGFIIAHFVSKIIGLLIHKFELASELRGRPRKPEFYIESNIRYIIYLIAFIAALERLGIIDVIKGIGIGIVGAALIILFALNIKYILANGFAGFKLHKKRKLKVGSNLKIGNTSGKIESIGLAEVRVLTKDKDIILIPNKYLLNRAE